MWVGAGVGFTVSITGRGECRCEGVCIVLTEESTRMFVRVRAVWVRVLVRAWVRVRMWVRMLVYNVKCLLVFMGP